MAEEKSQWISIGQAASYLGVSRDTLRRWDKKGKLKALRSPTNRRYYTKKQLDSIMSGKKEKRISRPSKRLAINKTQKLIIIGVLSFLAAALLVFLLQFFLL